MKKNALTCLSHSGIWSFTGLLLAALLMTAAALPASAQPLSLFQTYDQAGSQILLNQVRTPRQAAKPWVTRQRPALLALSSVLDARPGVGSVLRMDLFDGTVVDGQIQQVQRRAESDLSWVGRLTGKRGGDFYLTLKDGVLIGSISFEDGGLVEIGYLGDGVQEIRQLDAVAMPSVGRDDAPVPPRPARPLAAADLAAPPALADASTMYDVMVVYTPKARIREGGTAAIQAAIQNGVNMANTSYVNSLINTSMRLVHTAEINYLEDNDLSLNLSRLTHTNDGYMDEVHALRNAYGADLVVLMTGADMPSSAGIGWLLPALDTGYNIYGFCDVESNTITNHTFTHELGHNQGCAHDRENAGGPGLFSYSYGWRFVSGSTYRTIMAYAPGTRIGYFSNPNVSYLGVATGVAVGQPDEAYNALSINNAAATFANFRQAITETLRVTPDQTISVNGPWGGPFTPSSTALTLQNMMPGSINWTGSVAAIGGQNVFQLSSTGGTIGGSGSTGVTVSPAAGANLLAPGTYNTTATFTDTTNGVSRLITLIIEVRPVAAMGISTIGSPQGVGAPFGVTVTARDSQGLAVPGFTGTVDLSILSPGSTGAQVTDGPTNTSWDFPMFTNWEDARTQSIYLASELNIPAGEIDSLALYVVQVPGILMRNWTIRLKTTAQSSFSSVDWNATGWTIGYQADTLVSQTGWVTFNFATPFVYDGTSNLMIDFSFNNQSLEWAFPYGLCAYLNASANRSIYYWTDSLYGDPLTWSGATVPGNITTKVPSIQLNYHAYDSSPATPSTSGAFSGGAWTGSVTATSAASSAMLKAADAGGHAGLSNVFQILAVDTSTIWVQFGWGGTELGTQSLPFNTLGEGVTAVDTGGTLKVKTGASGTLASRITKAMRVESVGGTARIGAP